MPLFFCFYMGSWLIACVAVLFIVSKDKDSYAFSQKIYWLFLLRPWKLVSFGIAATGLIAIAAYTGDPTWDYFDAFFMSLLTYLSAPWAVGSIYKVIRKELPLEQAYVAFCIWMFSASWPYDLYLVIRDGDYPITWFSNIFASSLLYVSAGLLWNLDWIRGRGVTLAFMEAGWPSYSAESGFSKIIWLALPFMALVSFLILYFFLFKAGL